MKMNNYCYEEVNKLNFSKWAKLRHELWPEHSIEEIIQEANEIFNTFDEYFVLLVKINHKYIAMIEGIKKSNAIGFIEGIYVQELYRRKKIGTVLVKKMEEWVKSWNGKILESDTNEKYPLSPIFHEQLGFHCTELNNYYFWKQLL